MLLYLDDVREPAENGFIGATVVRTAADAINLLYSGLVMYASLDHDLMDNHEPEQTGMTVLDWLEQNPEFWPPHGVHIHTMNVSKYHVMRGVVYKHYGRNFE